MRFLILALAAFSVCGQTWQAGVAEVSAKDKSPGTGFVVAVRGDRAYLVTCAHVVEGDPRPEVMFRASPDEHYTATVRDLQDGRRDGLALLVVDKPPSGVRALQLSADSVETGTSVTVAGYPVSVGAWTVVSTTIASVRGAELYLERDTGDGFSGGPALKEGRVAGVVYGHASGFGRAVPAAIVEVYLRGLDVFSRPEAPKPNEAKVESTDNRKRPDPLPGSIWENPKDGLKYVWIPPGKFLMGCSQGGAECFADEKPAHEVTITRGFYMGQTEVTQEAYRRVTGKTPSIFKAEQSPVEQVSWTDAKSYCEAVGLRLPTEAEWEYAARAGSKDARYGKLADIAWYLGNSGGQTHPAKSKAPNASGLYDTLGNVREWVADWYDEGYYKVSTPIDPQGPSSGTTRGLRGGVELQHSVRPRLVPLRGRADDHVLPCRVSVCRGIALRVVRCPPFVIISKIDRRQDLRRLLVKRPANR